MKTKRILIVVYCLILVAASCKKNKGDGTAADIPVPVADLSNTPLAMLNREVGSVLEKVYANDDAYSEVNASIYSGYYEDEKVLLRDLLFPGESDLYSKEAFKVFGVDTGVFREVFCEIVDKGDYPLIKAQFKNGRFTKWISSASVLENLNPVTNVQVPSLQSVSIYFPYSENFGTGGNTSALLPRSLIGIKKPVIVAADREADAGLGRQPYICAGGIGGLCYREVVVDDVFAEKNPIHIVGAGAEPKQDAGEAALVNTAVSRVYHGWSRLTTQMDRLISLTGNGGGSEIKVARINGYLKQEDQQVTKFEGDVVSVQYTRSEIRNKKWKRVFSIWDPNWNYQDIEQVYAVYENDTQGEKTFSGSLSTTVNLPGKPSLGKAQGEISYKIVVMTQDEIITQRKQDRKSFFAEALNDQGWGFMSDSSDFLETGKNWPVVDGGTVWQYTWAYKMY